jgi:hypothetical protein
MNTWIGVGAIVIGMATMRAAADTMSLERTLDGLSFDADRLTTIEVDLVVQSERSPLNVLPVPEAVTIQTSVFMNASVALDIPLDGGLNDWHVPDPGGAWPHVTNTITIPHAAVSDAPFPGIINAGTHGPTGRLSMPGSVAIAVAGAALVGLLVKSRVS